MKDFCLSMRDCAVQIYKLYHDVGRTVFSGGCVSCLALISFVVWSCGFFKSSPSKLPFATWNIFCKNHIQYVMRQRIIYFYILKMALKWMWTLTSSLLVVLRIVTFGLELAGLFGTFPQCTWGFRVVLEFMVWHEAERRQIWTENICCFLWGEFNKDGVWRIEAMSMRRRGKQEANI